MTNSKENQNCLNCGHFQPYETEDPLVTANGECRRLPKYGPATAGMNDYVRQYWPYIAAGEDFWCSRWKRTTQTPYNQAGIRPGVFPGDFDSFHASPWNARAGMNISCWNCNHYQRNVDDPVDPGDNLGECRRNATPMVYEYDNGEESGTLQPGKFVYAGSSYWCSEWEHAEGDIPVDPGPAQP